jgi:hypothetical protein
MKKRDTVVVLVVVVIVVFDRFVENICGFRAVARARRGFGS